MQQKLRPAIHGRADADLMSIDRTDALASEGLDAALKRAEAYLAAWADGIFISGLPDQETLARAGAALRGAVHVTVVTERRMPRWAAPAALYDRGFVQVAFPNLLISRVTDAMRSGLCDLAEVTAAAGLQGLLGLDDWIALERDFA